MCRVGIILLFSKNNRMQGETSVLRIQCEFLSSAHSQLWGLLRGPHMADGHSVRRALWGVTCPDVS